MRRYVFPCLSQTWLNEAEATIGLSPIMGLLNENESLVYFAVLGELSSGLSLTVGSSRLAWFSIIISWGPGRGHDGHASQQPDVLVGLKSPNIGREIFLAFSTKFENHTIQVWLSRRVDRVHIKHVMSKVTVMSKTVVTFVQKVVLIWLKRGLNLAKKRLFTSAIQETNVIVGLKLLPLWSTWQKCYVRREGN